MMTFILMVIFYIVYDCSKMDILEKYRHISKGKFTLTCLIYGHWWVVTHEESLTYGSRYDEICPCCGATSSMYL